MILLDSYSKTVQAVATNRLNTQVTFCDLRATDRHLTPVSALPILIDIFSFFHFVIILSYYDVLNHFVIFSSFGHFLSKTAKTQCTLATITLLCNLAFLLTCPLSPFLLGSSFWLFVSFIYDLRIGVYHFSLYS
jgi:hypothetical protein